MFEWLIEKIREMEREQGSQIKRITCNAHNCPLNITLENGYWDAWITSVSTWANQRRLKEEIKVAFPKVKVIRIYTVSEEQEKELSVPFTVS